MAAADFEVSVLDIPADANDPGFADFAEMTRVRNAIETQVLGTDVLSYTAEELLPGWQNPYEPQVLLVARVDGRIVGRAIFEAPIEDGSTEVWFVIEVLEGFRGRGIGSTMYERLTRLAMDAGRPDVWQIWATHGEHPGERLPAATGFGSLALADPGVRFLTKRGYRLEQIERISRLDLPLGSEAMAGLRTEAESHAAEYRFESWTGRTPEHRIEDLALLRRRMSTDAPSAGLAFEEENWDAERVREQDTRMEKSSRTVATTVALHEPSGQIAGFTELNVPQDAGRPLEQNDTLVLKEHRGHRLGLLLKLTNLEYTTAAYPEHPMVTTFNAEENRPMLSVNEAMGFRPIAQAAGWRWDRAVE